MPLAVVHSILLTHDSSRVCPRREDWQLQCSDLRCFDCHHYSINLADLDLRLTAGETARLIAAALPIKSGRRRALLTEHHGNVPFEAVDVERMNEFDHG